MALVHARGYSRMQRKGTAEITETQSDLAGYVSCNWKKKAVSRFCSQGSRNKRKKQEVDDKLVSLSVSVYIYLKQ